MNVFTIALTEEYDEDAWGELEDYGIKVVRESMVLDGIIQVETHMNEGELRDFFQEWNS
jgi:hypothetical protein